jgi:hypothetical protein
MEEWVLGQGVLGGRVLHLSAVDEVAVPVGHLALQADVCSQSYDF